MYLAKLKLPIALDNKTGELIHISNITKDNKDQYEFLCPKCKTPLIPKMGDINTHHFAHKNADCTINGESIVHLLAKKIIADNNEIVVPIYNPVTLRWQHIKHKYKLVDLEKKYEDIIPDVVIEVEGRLVFIEVAYTHFIDEKKYEKLKKIGIETWEIDLNGYIELSKKEFEKKLLNDIDNKKSFVLKYGDYKNYLNADCLEFAQNNKYIYKLLLIQYKKIKEYWKHTFNFYGMLEFDNVCKIIDTQNNISYWIAYEEKHIDEIYSYYYIYIYYQNRKQLLFTFNPYIGHEGKWLLSDLVYKLNIQDMVDYFDDILSIYAELINVKSNKTNSKYLIYIVYPIAKEYQRYYLPSNNLLLDIQWKVSTSWYTLDEALQELKINGISTEDFTFDNICLYK